VEENFCVGACEACCAVWGAVVAEAESDGFGTIVFGFEDGGPETLDLWVEEKFVLVYSVFLSFLVSLCVSQKRTRLAWKSE